MNTGDGVEVTVEQSASVGGEKIDYLQQRLIEKESKVKSPTLAAVLGFFFPFLGFLYVKRYVAAGITLVLWLCGAASFIIGIGFGLFLLSGIICSYLCYKTADKLNTSSLRKALTNGQLPA